MTVPCVLCVVASEHGLQRLLLRLLWDSGIIKLESLMVQKPRLLLLQALSNLTKLKQLSLSMSDGMYIGAWPDWSRLKSIKSMTLRGSRGYMFSWAALPGWFAGLAKLQSLDIR